MENAKIVRVCVLVCGCMGVVWMQACMCFLRETAWKVWWQGEVTRDGKLMQTNTPTLNQTSEDHTGLITF